MMTQSKSLSLGQIESPYIIAGESADLFHAPPQEARLALGRLPVGTIVFPMPEGMLGPCELLALPATGAVFQALDQDNLPDFADYLFGITLWLNTLAEATKRLVVPTPRADLMVGRGEAAVQKGQVVMASGPALWCNPPPEGALLYGIEPVFEPVALPQGAWLTLEGDGILQTRHLGEGDWVAAVFAFNKAFVELLPVLRGLSETDEHNRLLGRKQAADADKAESAKTFAQLQGNALPEAEGQTDEPLFKVLRRLLQPLDIKLKRPLRANRAQMDRAFTLEEIARASGFAIQQVALGPLWWKHESAALLLHDQEGRPWSAFWASGRFVATSAQDETLVITAETSERFGTQAVQIFAELGAKSDFIGLLQKGLKARRLDLLAILLAAVVGGILGQILPLATNAVFSVVVPAANPQQLAPLAALIAGLAFAAYMLNLSSGIARQRSMAHLQHHSFRAMWDRICRLPMSWHNRQSSADIVARASGATGALSTVTNFGLTLAGQIGLMLSSLWVIASQMPIAAGLLALLLVLHLSIGWFAAWAQMRAFGQGEALQGTADSFMVQMIGGLAKLRSAAAEERLLFLWLDRFIALRARSIAARRIADLLAVWLTAFPILASALLFLLIQRGQSVEQGLDLAAVMMVISAFAGVIFTVNGILQGFLMLLMAKPGWTYGKPLLEQKPEARQGLTDPGVLAGEIELSGLSFAHRDQPPLFRGLSLSIAAGEMVAIVGPSGSGKTTLLNLILGLEEPSSGAVYLDGHDLRGLDPTAVRRQIGSVLQDDSLPPGSIWECLREGGSYSELEIWQALDKAAIAREIMAMPMRLHTLLSDARRNLSGGQIQRLTLARLFLHNPQVVILDEATSALDGQAQAQVMAHIAQMRATRIIVAHRLSTIRRADRIFVLDQGQIVESGSHEALMQKRGSYFRLVSGQTH